jgi:hypothetical protein
MGGDSFLENRFPKEKRHCAELKSPSEINKIVIAKSSRKRQYPLVESCGNAEVGRIARQYLM